ncbi:MAG: FAD-dependent oxidoreductase [Solirubrobacteraceae bacterium]|nr:FAD-dependent oxidoreductase [Solirubrobacteraceae bacterium]
MARIAVVGGGILGATLTLRLAQQGHDVQLLERGAALGGLADRTQLAGYDIDRFYHVIVPSDARMHALVDELGLTDEMSNAPVGVGFFSGGKMYPFNGIGDFLKFPPLKFTDRLRLARFVVACQLRSQYADLEDKPLLEWLRKMSGKRVVDKIWRPLLDSRFDGHHEELPATYLWSRTRRMRSARSGKGGAEEFGALRGGHQRLIEAAAKAAEESGAIVRTGVPVTGLLMEGGNVAGVTTEDGDERYDLVIPTLQPPALKFLLPAELQPLLGAYPQRFLGVVCLILLVKESLTEHYSVNIVDPTPITTIVETSHVVGTDHTGGNRLVYVPRYCDPKSETFGLTDQEVYDRFTEMVAKLSPAFRHEDVLGWTVQRAPTVEPVHAKGVAPREAPIFPSYEDGRPIRGLALASASQIYPRLLNGESVVQLAEEVAVEVDGILATDPARLVATPSPAGGAA